MQIRELRFNILFEYIKEIKRYTYDIQDYLEKNNFCDKVNMVPPVPDDLEPQIERLSTTRTLEDKVIHIFVSQASISILFVYSDTLNFKSCFKDEAKLISTISEGIKTALMDKKKDLKINFEGLIVATSQAINKENSKLINELSLNENIEEDRKKTVKELDSKYFVSIEKSAVKHYSDSVPNFNVMSIKNKKDDFIGWNYILVLEVNNRFEYHNSKNESTHSLNLDYGFAITKIEEIFESESIKVN